MIRSSKHTLKFSNKRKREDVKIFLSEYRRLLQLIIDRIWINGVLDLDIQKNKLRCPSMLPNDYLKQFDSWFTARMKQCVGKQACSMIRAATAKRRKQLYMLSKLQHKKSTKYLQRKIDVQPLVKPDAIKAKAELDSRFIDFQDGNSFGLFVRVKTIGNKITFKLPINHHKSSRKWFKLGNLKNSIRLSQDQIVLIFDVPDTPKHDGRIVGADQGYKTVLSLSDRQVTTKDSHGHDLVSIQKKLERRKKGSNGFRRAQDHRKNHIHWSLNQLNFSKIKEVRLEKVRKLRYKSRGSRLMSHWTYPLIRQKLVSLGETEGFRLVEVDNQFRSQRCSQCGWVCRANRKGKTFKCGACGFSTDADLNAASNLELDLFEIPFWVQQQKLNRQGFYWMPDGLYSIGYEPIVRNAERVLA